MRKKILEKRMARLTKKKNDLTARALASQDAAEVRSINEQLTDVNDEIAETQEEIDALNEEEGAQAQQNGAESSEGTPAEGTQVQSRGGNPMASYSGLGAAGTPAAGTQSTEQREADPRGTMEYRQAFMEYIQRGTVNKDVLQFEKRADAAGTSSDLGVLIPSTVVQSIITGVEKVYGQLYSRVRKTNIQGGVKFPIGSFAATFNRITETTISDRQDAGGVTGYVEFSYKIGEIRLARTLLQTVLTVPAFEEKFAEVIVKAYVKAMDKEIMTGVDANNECVGILTEAAKTTGSRIPADNIIEFTEADMADWTAWQKKLFAKIPLSMRGLSPEFVMTPNTYEANIKTLKDANDRPVYTETFNPVDGAEIARFKGKNVVFVEEDILKNFDDAVDSDYFGMYWVAEEAYAINSNMQFTVVDYFDHEKNQWVKKALVINDGKILDPKYIYLLKKSIPTG